jgi:hypothetical protein
MVQCHECVYGGTFCWAKRQAGFGGSGWVESTEASALTLGLWVARVGG